MTTAVVPTMNEEDTIGPLVMRLAKMCDPIYVADASDDLTPIYAELNGARVITCSESGLGPAYLNAWWEIPNDEWVVHVDAGDSHDLGSIQQVVSCRQADLVIGSRFMRGGKYEGNRAREFTSRMAAAACRGVTGTPYTDWTSGLRAYSPRARALLLDYEFTTVGHAWQIEALWACIQGGLRIVEVPIFYRAGHSQLNRTRVQEAVGLWARMARSS